VRAIGTANGRNPLPILLPCHRVIGTDGKLHGFAGGLDKKRLLLDHEVDIVARIKRSRTNASASRK
jgi:methylated-DNA-[protein]-cysteine S-methyltransferase